MSKSKLIFLLIAGCICLTCNSLSQAKLPEIKQAEKEWKQKPILNYRIVVDVHRGDELRRNSLEIHGGRITHAVVSYWDSRRKEWDREKPLNLEQALPFTVPGLLQTVEEEITNNQRTEIRVLMKGIPPLPQMIVLGDLIQGSQPVAGSKAYISITTFQPVV